ncbi:lipocalin-like domain-containing protein [Flavobacterium cerinum]|uniref:Lipocalin-like domain-containing protein n=1 Tax=Flavobacterium cerinum TaxID=2502784 RepID=A0A3S3RL49_9FLAO|nr:lipocalin family protein [Flavobacterium cerinum]RWX02575.1 hypothetical protein EPI11_04990 [Flavobacterium cerinum]
MKKTILLLFVSIVALSCGNSISEADLAKLNGYWEIETAVMPDGSEKEYKINTTIDFFELKGKTGFRKKVMPQFDGSYRMNDLSEKISIVQDSGKTYVSYVTDYAKWKEEIVELNDKKLVLKNNHDMEYHYKKPEPFTVK